MLRIALLADLSEPVGPHATSDAVITAFEIIAALSEVVVNVGEIAVDVVARRGSWRALPLISIDPDDLPAVPDSGIDGYARQEALYCQLVLAGMLRGYDCIHAVAPLVTPLQLLASTGVPIVQTITAPAGPSSKLLPILLPPDRFRRIASTRQASESLGVPMIEMSVDLERFRPDPASPRNVLLRSGAHDDESRDHAAELARLLGLEMRRTGTGDAVEALSDAAVLFHAESDPAATPHWPLRAIASGLPAVGWSGGALDELAAHPAICAVAPRGDVAALADAITNVQDADEPIRRRREYVLGTRLRRGMASRYSDLYKTITGG
jgi:hypothetical protein